MSGKRVGVSHEGADVRHARAPDLVAIVEQGRAVRDELVQMASDVAAVARIQARAERGLAHVRAIKNPALRAQYLGKLADWLASEKTQEVLMRASLGTPMGRGRPQESRRRVPSWVPADLAVIYRREAKAHSEFSAAALVRQIKRERALIEATQ